MEAELDYTKTAQQNAQAYFEKSKGAKKKIAGAEQAIKRLGQRMSELEKERVVRKELKKREERDWYERFNWFFASDGRLAIGGRSAQQNEEVVAKYFDSNDLFFHANVFGASAVVLKNGTGASEGVREEAAQFAACYSKAWEDGLSAVDVFSARKGQVSKSSRGGSLGTGSFLISGERGWYRNVKLELAAFKGENMVRVPTLSEQLEHVGPYIGITSGTLSVLVNAPKISIVPFSTYAKRDIATGLKIALGKLKKSDAAKLICKKLGYGDIDYIMQHLPSGGFLVE